MKPIQVAACCLIFSAVVLAGLLVARLSQRAANEVHAEMVISRDQFTMLTAQTRSGEESLFILDNASGTLLVYKLNVARDIIEPLGGLRLEQLFGGGGGGRGGR